MQFFVVAILAAIATVTQAAPATSENPTFSFKKRSSINDCGNSSFTNESSLGSPKISDCQMITRNIAGGGTYTTGCGSSTPRQLVSYGTCAFNVISPNSCTIFKVGNQDIIDLINTSIQMFSYKGLVGSKGTMPCQTLDGSATVHWGLYHT